MGACSSYNRVYEENSHLKLLQPQFEALQLRPYDIGRLYELFLMVDADKSGTISLDELMTRLSVDRTVFRDRVFAIFDEDGSGNIDFREFTLSLWNYCTLTKATLVLFAFDLYDTDSTGELSPDEIDQMINDLYGKHARTNIQAKMITTELKAIEDGATLNVDKFRAFAYRHPALLFPAFQMQNTLQEAVLGHAFWERCASRRMTLGKGRTVNMATMAAMNVNSDLFSQNTGMSYGKDEHGKDALLIHPKDQMAQLIIQSTGTHAYRKANAAKKNAEKSKNVIPIAGLDHAGHHDSLGNFASPHTPKTHHTEIHNEKFTNDASKGLMLDHYKNADPLDAVLKDVKSKHGDVKFITSPKRKHVSPNTIEENEVDDEELELMLELAPRRKSSNNHPHSRPQSSSNVHRQQSQGGHKHHEFKANPSSADLRHQRGGTNRSGTNSPVPKAGKGDQHKGKRRQTFT